MDTFLFTLQTTNGIIFIWTLFSSPYRQQTELYLYGHFSLHLVDNKRNYISWTLFSSPYGIIIFIWTLFSSPELYLYDNKRNYIYMDTFLFTIQTTKEMIFIWTLFSSPYRQQTELYLYGHFSLHLIDNKRNYIIWTLISSPYRQHFSLHLGQQIDNKRNYIYMDTFLFTIQTTNGIIFTIQTHFSLHHIDNKRNYIYMDTFLFTIFSSPYRQQTELYLYGHFSLHHIDNKRNYIYMGIIFIWTLFSSPYRTQQTELYIYMDTFLFTLQTTNGIIFSLHIDNKRIFIRTLFSSPYRQQTELYLYGLSSPYRQQTEL